MIIDLISKMPLLAQNSTRSLKLQLQLTLNLQDHVWAHRYRVLSMTGTRPRTAAPRLLKALCALLPIAMNTAAAGAPSRAPGPQERRHMHVTF